MFRVHKLCGAKYNYFSSALSDWQPVYFQPDRMQYSNFVLEKDWITMEGFRHKETGRLITITKLQQIRDKDKFVSYMEVVSDKKSINNITQNEQNNLEIPPQSN